MMVGEDSVSASVFMILFVPVWQPRAQCLRGNWQKRMTPQTRTNARDSQIECTHPNPTVVVILTIPPPWDMLSTSISQTA